MSKPNPFGLTPQQLQDLIRQAGVSGLTKDEIAYAVYEAWRDCGGPHAPAEVLRKRFPVYVRKRLLAADRANLSAGERAILDMLRQENRPLTAQEIADLSGKEVETVKKYLRPGQRLRRHHLVGKCRAGYTLSGKVYS